MAFQKALALEFGEELTGDFGALGHFLDLIGFQRCLNIGHRGARGFGAAFALFSGALVFNKFVTRQVQHTPETRARANRPLLRGDVQR